MVKVCAVKSCPSGRKKKNKKSDPLQTLSFFKPTTAEKIKKWQKSLGFQLKVTDYICHLHFKAEQLRMYVKYRIKGELKIVNFDRIMLREDACPTIEHQFVPMSDEMKAKLIEPIQNQDKSGKRFKSNLIYINDQGDLEHEGINYNHTDCDGTDENGQDPKTQQIHQKEFCDYKPTSELDVNFRNIMEKLPILPPLWLHYLKTDAVEFMHLDPKNMKVKIHIRLNKDLTITVIFSNGEELPLNVKISSLYEINDYLRSVEKWPTCVGTQMDESRFAQNCRGVIINKTDGELSRCKNCRILRQQLHKIRSTTKILKLTSTQHLIKQCKKSISMWDISESAVEQDQICEPCIGRLRDANDFKKIVLDSQEGLQQIEETNIKEEKLEAEFLEFNESEDYTETAYADTEYTAHTGDTMDSVKDEYEEVEYLEDNDLADNAVDTDSSQLTDQPTPARRKKQPRQQDTDDNGPKRKWPKKLPKSERHKTYKQYSEENLRNCLEEVRNQELTVNEASLKYNIPKKTICGKLKMEPKGEAHSYREKCYQLIKEIKAILTFTNATPYKSKNIRYYCAYCSTDGPHFEDPDDLRNHTRTAHVSHRIEKIEYAMRPYWSNEILKLDIDNLLCTVCCVVINNWNDMFKHLKEKHNVVLDQAYTRVIPYVLRTDLRCALCKESFSNYLHLDGHMNAHYNNYVCDDCGDTFLAQTRLKQHVKIHNVGKYPCSLCDKVFTLQKYRRKHEELVHKQASKFKCLYCPEKFTGEYLRHLHCLEAHEDKVKIITCEICGQTFSWRQYYMVHMRKKHGQNKAIEFESDKNLGSYEVKESKIKHGANKKYECSICNKKYVSLNSLKHHSDQHKHQN